MGDWPMVEVDEARPPVVIGSHHPNALGVARFHSANPASAAWPAANLALFVPFSVGAPCIAYKMVVGCGATASGNFDVGIYDPGGHLLVSSGATGKTASTEVVCDITDTVLLPGTYFMAMAADGTNNYIATAAAGNLGMFQMVGMRQMATAYVLPSTATFASVAQTFLPDFGVYLKALA